MRPATLAETYERILAGADCDVALAEFLDTFYLTATADGQLDGLRGEPRLTGDARIDALAGAMAEYLARQYELPSIPPWAFEPVRYLEHAWHASSFTEERPLRRARSGLKPS